MDRWVTPHKQVTSPTWGPHLHVIRPLPAKFCINVVFNSLGTTVNNQDKLKTMVMFFFKGGGGGGVNEVSVGKVKMLN